MRAKSFRFGFDPLWLAACSLYVVNSWFIPGPWKGAFFHGYFNDLLLIPAALPVVLGLQGFLGLRERGGGPRWHEIGLSLFAWAFIAEVVTPLLFPHTTSDCLDVLAYAAGAVVSGLWWNRRRLFRLPKLA